MPRPTPSPPLRHAAWEEAQTLGKLKVERIDGEFAVGTPLGLALVEAGFVATPQGLRLRNA